MAVATPTVRRPSILGVGVVVWLASELMFFAGLFAAYFTLRSVVGRCGRPRTPSWRPSAPRWPPCFLIASSFTMHLAVRASEGGDRRRSVRWLLVTMVLGGVFLTNQAIEYVELPFSISSHAYGSMFYLLTGFHGLHVLGGLGFMLGVIAIIAGRTSRAPVGPDRSPCAPTTGTSWTSCGSSCSPPSTS